MRAQHSVSVAATIADQSGRLLVTRRRDNGRWEPPGGVLEVDQSILDGLKREVFEEAGLTIEPLRLTGGYKNMMCEIIALMFRAQVAGGHASTSSETSDIEWWAPELIAERMDPAYVIRTLDALRTDGPAVRAHDGVSLFAGIAALPD